MNIDGYTLYNMMQIDNQLFGEIELYEKIDKELTVTEIVKYCGDLVVTEYNPALYKAFINSFFKKNYDVFRNLYDSMHYEYEPLENLNRFDENERIVENTSDSTDNNTTGQESSISAMDSGSYQPDRKTDSDSNTSGHSESSGSDKYWSHSHGTIGVITTQDMIEKQRRVVRYEVYTDIAKMFQKELCVSVY